MVIATEGHTCRSSRSCCCLRSPEEEGVGCVPGAELSCDPGINGLCKAPGFRAALGDPGQLSVPAESGGGVALVFRGVDMEDVPPNQLA